MSGKIQNVKLNNGREIPIFGLGTWKSKPGEVEQAVKDAIDLGYRHIDCAHVYGNEKEVGNAIAQKIKEGKIAREDIFVTSKLWNTYHSQGLVEPAIKKTLEDLQLQYLDLYLIHWPVGYKEGGPNFPFDDEDQMQFSNVDYTETWLGMEGVFQKGLTKSIGLSNFNKKQIERILEVATVKPVINQVECHPYLNQQRLIDFCRSKGIEVTAYSPLGSPDRPWAQPGEPQLLDEPKLKALAAKHGKTPAQILLRFQVDRGIIVIPKSVTQSRIAENLNIFDFVLDSEDLDYLKTFDCNGRLVPMNAAIKHPLHPFVNDEY